MPNSQKIHLVRFEKCVRASIFLVAFSCCRTLSSTRSLDKALGDYFSDKPPEKKAESTEKAGEEGKKAKGKGKGKRGKGGEPVTAEGLDDSLDKYFSDGAEKKKEAGAEDGSKPAAVDAEMEEPDLEAGTAKVPESCSPPF